MGESSHTPSLVLGVHFGHEAGVAVVDTEGLPVFAISEERLTRVKMQEGIPWQSLALVGERFGYDTLKKMPIAVAGLPKRLDRWRCIQRYRFCDRHGLQHESHWLTRSLGYLVLLCLPSTHRAPHYPVWRRYSEREIVGIDHHLAHAASAYFCSGSDRALVVTIDGQGNQLSATLYAGEQGCLRLLAQRYYSDFPIGLHYNIITGLLGFSAIRHCGKVTGLAAWGHPNPDCRQAMETFFARIWQRGGYPYRRMGWADIDRYAQEGRRVLAAYSPEDIAFAIQALTEEAACEWVAHGRTLFDADTAVLAGGLFANVRVNQHVKAMGFSRVFVQPAMSDAGLPLGAAQAFLASKRALRPRALRHVFLGPAPTPDELLAALHQAGERYSQPENMAATVADLLVRHRTVARFDGPMEFGPRALGNRSILVHAQDRTINDWLNKRLRRTEFMPFAPVTACEDASRYYEGFSGLEHTARFMTVTVDCTPWMKTHCPAAVHVDGTARPQLADPETTPGLYAILMAYRDRTGLSTIINTSFNMHEEPIVCTPRQAIVAWRQSGLDALVLGPYLVLRESATA